MGWTIGAISQAFTGATGESGSVRKKWHRIMGWVVGLLGFLGTAVTIVADICRVKQSAAGGMATYLTGTMIFANLTYGLWSAQQKGYVRHKAAMTWACGWTAWPGTVRLANYMAYLVGGCPVQYGFTLIPGTILAFGPNGIPMAI